MEGPSTTPLGLTLPDASFFVHHLPDSRKHRQPKDQLLWRWSLDFSASVDHSAFSTFLGWWTRMWCAFSTVDETIFVIKSPSKHLPVQTTPHSVYIFHLLWLGHCPPGAPSPIPRVRLLFINICNPWIPEFESPSTTIKHPYSHSGPACHLQVYRIAARRHRQLSYIQGPHSRRSAISSLKMAVSTRRIFAFPPTLPPFTLQHNVLLGEEHW